MTTKTTSLTTKTTSYIGKKERFKGTVGNVDYIRDKICIINITSLDGEFRRNHCWVDRCKRFKNLKLKKGQRIELSATLTEYIGLKEGTSEVVRKIGIERPRNIRRV